MTSKNLFFKLIWQDFKQRIWCPILIFLAYFMVLEIRLLNYLGRMEKYPSDYEYAVPHYLANRFFAPDTNDTILYVTIVVGAVCALSGYVYLHSRRQLDTYHSMPVKRESLFFSRYLSGILMFVIPYAIHTLICLMIGMTKGAFSGHGLINAIGFGGVQLLYFLLIYSVCVIAMCLTGNIIISILGSCVLVGYSSILSVLRDALFDEFFHTYLSSYSEDMWAFSPIGMMMKLNEYAADYRKWNSGFSYRCIVSYSLVILLAIVIFTAIGLLLYKKRATEAAGKPIAFAITEPFIKAMVVIPASIYCGLLIRGIADGSSFGWLIFGIALGFIVVALVMEIIFRLDIKCAFYHWKQLVFNGACLALMVMILKYDVLGYNTYVPSEQELSDCAVSIEGLMDIYLEERADYYGGYSYNYTSAMDYRFEHMNVLDNPSVMALARKAAADNLQHEGYEYYEGVEDSPEYQALLEREAGYRRIAYRYTKGNGKHVYREYIIDISDEETLSLLADVFADSDYKLGAFPILTNGWKKEYSSLFCTSNDFTESVKLSSERQARLFEVYQSELLDLTLDEVMNEVPLGNMTFQLKGYSKNSYGGAEEGYKIYPSFTATIELLKEYGFDYTQELSADKAKKIIVTRYDRNLWANEDGIEAVAVEMRDYSNEIVLEYSDEECKNEILSNIVNIELLNGVTNYLEIEVDDDEVVVYYDADGVEESRGYHFYPGRKPDYIETDFEKKKEEVRKEIFSQE